jgi:hypothetical protein
MSGILQMISVFIIGNPKQGGKAGIRVGQASWIGERNSSGDQATNRDGSGEVVGGMGAHPYGGKRQEGAEIR